MCLFGLRSGLPPVEIRHESAITRGGQAIRDAANLIVDSPPFLNDDDRRRTIGIGGFRKVAFQRL